MTTAEQISALLRDDGQVWEAADGRSFDELIAEHGGTSAWRDGFQTGDVVRHTFPDGSVITVAGDGWDFGYPECFCWQGAGHTEECDSRVGTSDAYRMDASDKLIRIARECGVEMHEADHDGPAIETEGGDLCIYWDTQDPQATGWAYQIYGADNPDSGPVDDERDLRNILGAYLAIRTQAAAGEEE